MKNFETMCEDCPNLVKKNGKWLCYECFEQAISDLDECPEGLTPEQVVKAQTLTPEQKKAVKSATITTSMDKKEARKPRTVKENPEKIAIIEAISKIFDSFPNANAEITNKSREIVLKIGENDYKITLTATRKAKKSENS